MLPAECKNLAVHCSWSLVYFLIFPLLFYIFMLEKNQLLCDSGCVQCRILFGIYSKQPTHQKSSSTVYRQHVCLRPAAHVLPLLPPLASRLSVNATEMSVTFMGYMWTDVSSLITMSSLVWSSATKAPFTALPCLLSSISLEFHCSGWEAPEASRQTWSQWRNTVLYKHL